MRATEASRFDRRYAEVMKRLLILVAALAGCADDAGPDPKSEVDCGDSWQFGSQHSCDLACEEMPADVSGPSCDTNLTYTPLGGQPGPYPCAATFESSGRRGCCFDDLRMDATIEAGVPDEPSRTRRVFFLTCK